MISVDSSYWMNCADMLATFFFQNNVENLRTGEMSCELDDEAYLNRGLVWIEYQSDQLGRCFRLYLHSHAFKVRLHCPR